MPAADRALLDRVCALAAVTGAVVSHPSAAVLWGIPLPLAAEGRAAGWHVLVFTQGDLTPAVPGREPRAVTRVRAALLERGWAPQRP